MSVQNNETEQCLMREVHIYKWAGTKKNPEMYNN